MKKTLPAFLALSLSYVSAFSQCLIPKASGDTVFPVTGNYYTDSSAPGYASEDCQIYNLARTGNQYYVLGNFKYIGPNQGPGVVIDSASGTVVSSKTWRPNGFVRASIPDGQGGFYIAGDFTQIGNVARSHLAQIDGNGKPTAWAPQVNGQVYTLFKRNDTLFVGGLFTRFANQTRYSFAIWSIAGDTLITHLPVTTDTSAAVYAIKPYGPDKLFIAGALGYGGASSILQYDIPAGQVTTWAPPSTVYGFVQSIELSSDQSILYYTDESTRLLVAADPVTGQQKFRLSFYDLSAGIDIGLPMTLKTVGNTLYIGGTFTRVTDASGATYLQHGICAVDAATGVLKNFDPQLNNSEVAYIDAHGSNLIISGLFNQIGDSSRQFLALVDTGTYALNSWHPLPSDGVLTVSYSGGRIFVGGVFTGLQAVARNGLAAFDGATGQILPFNPPATTIYWGKKMAVRGDTLFALVRTDDLEAAQETDQLLLYSRSTGTQLATPTMNWSAMEDFIFDGNYMYAATDTYVQRYGLPGLALDASWKANFDIPEASEPQALCQDSTTIYTVGDNRSGAGSEFPYYQYTRFSRIDKANSANITSYQYIDTVQSVDPRPRFNHAFLSDSILFVQGAFSSLNGIVTRNLAAINVRTGNVVNWSPKAYGSTSPPYTQPFAGAEKFQPFNGGIWFGYDQFYTNNPTGSSQPNAPFGAMDSTTGIFLAPPFTIAPAANSYIAPGLESGQFIQNAVNDFLLDPDQPVIVGGFGDIDGQPFKNIARLTYGTYSLPTTAQTIAGPDTVVVGRDSVQYTLADTLAYNWSYAGSNVTIVNNGQDPVFLSFASNATGGALAASGMGYCGSTASTAQKNIVVIHITPAPKVNACCMVFTNTQTDRTSLTFSAGNGAGRLVVASTSPVAPLPVLGTVYNANSIFGVGSSLGAGSFTVYTGAGDSVTVTGLQSATKYYFIVFEYAISNDTIKYQLQQAYSDSITTLSPAPIIPPSNIQFSQVGTTSLTVSCIPGNGTGRVYLFKASDPILSQPQDGYVYGGNSIFSYGYAFNDGSYVVADTGTRVNVTNLSPGTTYFVKIFEYSGSGGATSYLTSAYAADTITTTALPVQPNGPLAPTVTASDLTVTGITTNTATVSCTPGNGQNRLFVIRPVGTIVDTPVTGHTYTANPAFGAGSNLGDSTFVVATTGTSVTITGLSSGTKYTVAVFESNGSGDSTVYLGHSFPTRSFTTDTAQDTRPTANWQDSSFAIKVYPNPTHGNSQLQITSNETSTIMIRIVAFGGDMLEEMAFTITPGINTYTVSYLAGLPKGLYILYWRTNDQKGSVKVIKF